MADVGILITMATVIGNDCICTGSEQAVVHYWWDPTHDCNARHDAITEHTGTGL